MATGYVQTNCIIRTEQWTLPVNYTSVGFSNTMLSKNVEERIIAAGL